MLHHMRLFTMTYALSCCRNAVAASRALESSGKSVGDGSVATEGSLLTQPKHAPRVHRPIVRESDMRKFATQVRLSDASGIICGMHCHCTSTARLMLMCRAYVMSQYVML